MLAKIMKSNYLSVYVIALLVIALTFQHHQISTSINNIRDTLTRSQRSSERSSPRSPERSSPRSPERSSVPSDPVTKESRHNDNTGVDTNEPITETTAFIKYVSNIQAGQALSKEEIDEHRTKLALMDWPALTGYDNRFVTEEANGIDKHLYDRIALHQHMYAQPLLTLKNQGEARHDWKFEKIIHQTWIDEQIPGRTVPWVKKWLELNPDWTYIFWTDKAAKDFVQTHFPALFTAYESYQIPVQKAGMFRYIALYAFGGVFADLDVEGLKNLEEVRTWSSCVLGREPDMQTFVMSNFLNSWGNNRTFTSNAFMGCRAHHPFLHYVISRVVHWSPYVLKRTCPLSASIACSGSWMMSFAYAFYRRSLSDNFRALHKEIDVICPHYSFFLPTFDESRRQLVDKNCDSQNLDDKQKGICKEYIDVGKKNEPVEHSFTNHHWFHSYHNNVNVDQVDVRTVTKVLQWTPDTEGANFHVSYPQIHTTRTIPSPKS